MSASRVDYLPFITLILALLETTGVRAADLIYNATQTVATRQDLGAGLSSVTLTNGVTVTFSAPAYAGSGGAISAESLVFTGSGNFVFDGNVASVAGGAIYVSKDFSGGLVGALFTGNQARTAGAMYVEGNFSGGIINSIFTDNIGTSWSNFGGGVGVKGNFTGNISGSSFIGNQGAGNFGGAIGIQNNLYGDIIDSVFRNNVLADSPMPATETHFGGAIGISGTLYGGIYNSEFTNNIAMTATSGGAYGGAISVTSLTGGIHNTLFDGNSAKWGGALALAGGTLSGGINDSTFKNNIATGQGGAIYSSASATGSGITGGINRSSFINNSATGIGGAIIAQQLYGGINNSLFEGNVAGSHGGAIASLITLDGGINESAFYNNSAVGHGGAVRAAAFSNGGIASSIFTGNSAGERGGALYSSGSVAIDGSQFRDNTAGALGGAIYVNSGDLSLSTLTDNIVFSGNMHNQSSSLIANAIYLNNGMGSTTASFDALADRIILFRDPIASSGANGLISVIKTGDGLLSFDGVGYSRREDRWSSIYANTVVNRGTFEVANSAEYGVRAANVGAGTDTSFRVNSGAILQGGMMGTVHADQFVLSDGATLGIAGRQPDVRGTFVINAFNATLEPGSIVAFRTVLNDGAVQNTDRLIFSDAAVTGMASVRITNVEGSGGLTTGNGILLIDVVNGATTASGAFALAGPVVAGPYEYTLFRSGIDASNSNLDAWYLRSVFDCTLAPNAPECVSPVPPPNYRVETSVYAALPSMTLLYGRNLIGTLHERVGEEEDIRGHSDLHQQTPNTGAWGRVIGTHGKQNGDALGIFKSGPQYNYDFISLQMGQDLFRYEHTDSSRDHVGVYFAYGHASGTVTHFDGASGSNKFNAYTLGGYWTRFGATGGYVDLVLQGTRYDATSTANRGLPDLTPNGNGVAVSLEGGQPFRSNQGHFIEPQAQLIYQTINFGDASDSKALVQFTKVDSLAGRIGVRYGSDVPGRWTMMRRGVN